MIRIFILVCAAHLGRAQTTYTKTWVVNTVLNDTQFWNSMVTMGDLLFNASMQSAMAVTRIINSTEEACELVYPLDNQSLDTYTAEITYSNVDCLDDEITKKMERLYWIDPRNWASFGFTVATPHAEMIPCNYDAIKIANTTSTVVILPPEPVILKSFLFGYTYLYPRSLKSLSQNEYFMKHFIVKYELNLENTFNISSSGCKDRTGCLCGTSDYHEDICSFVEDNCTSLSKLQCEKPVKPIGHCCPVCGSTLLVVFNKDRFVYKKLTTLVMKYVQNENTQLKLNIVVHISKVMESMLQIILLPDPDYTEELEDIANGLEIFLKSQSNLAVDDCMVENSGKKRGQGWLTGWRIFIFLLTVLIGGIVIVYASKLKFFGELLSMFKFKSNSEVKYGLNKDDKNVLHKSNTEETTQAGEVSKSGSNEAVNLIDSFS